MWSSPQPWAVPQHVHVEREVGDQALQPRILVLELADPPDLVDPEMPVPPLPHVERGLADPELTADITDRRPGVRLAERVGDLLLRELRALHRAASSARLQTAEAAFTLVWGAVDFRGDVRLARTARFP